ncbi:MAG: TIGR02597 family protein [Opitutales bacterium]|nr:TIGR02597 family protein [Opitutales bacterium]
MKSKFLIFSLSAALAAPLGLNAGDVSVATDPVGYVTIEIPANSDGLISVPLSQSSEFVGTINAFSSGTISVEGDPDFTEDVFYDNGHHFVVFASGDAEGLYATINGNESDEIDILFHSHDFSDLISPGDSFKVVKAHTFGSVFTDIPDGVQILLFNSDSTGINKSSSTVVTNFEDFGWFSGSGEENDSAIFPGEGLILRNNTSTSLSVTFQGAVEMNSQGQVLFHENLSSRQDVRFGLRTGAPVEVGEIDFNAVEGDQILIFSNSTSGTNKSSSLILTYFDGFGWFSGSGDENDFQLEPGVSYIYRLAPNPEGNAERVIRVSPNYITQN